MRPPIRPCCGGSAADRDDALASDSTLFMSRLSRLKRTVLLSLLARQTPEKLLAAGRKRLPAVFQRAARHCAAYRTLLEEAGVRAEQCTSGEQVLQCAPILTKADLFERFPIQQLMVDKVPPTALAGVLTSSGHGGSNFAFGVSTRRQHHLTPDDIDLGLQQAFGIDQRSTLLVNCLPMGVVFTSNTVCVANVSVREDMALAILRQAGPLFDQAILCTDPLFCKRLLDYAAEQAFDWSQLRMNVILGEEMFSEDYRSYLAAALQVPLDEPDGTLIGSSMGVGELGLNLFFETSETIALRRALHRQNPDQPLPSYFCFNPLRSYVEIVDAGADGVGDLVITMLDREAPVPMIRYRTGDRARWLTAADREPLTEAGRRALAAVPFPMLAMHGRARDRVNADWHVDHFKALLYRKPAVADQLSGAFRVLAPAEGGLRLDVQLAQVASRGPEAVGAELQSLIAEAAARRGAEVPELRCFSYASFPHGMGLDYERKFRYFPEGA